MNPLRQVDGTRILVSGEALIDLVPVDEDSSTYRAMPGGSPFNVAVGLARLDVPTGFVGRLSVDPFGRRLRAALIENGVATDSVRDDPGPTTLALVTRTPGREPHFAFYGSHAADQQLLSEDLPTPVPDSVTAIHVGSYAMTRQPIGATLTEWMRREHGHRVVSFDPNIRPQLIPDPQAYRNRIGDWIRLSHVVKLSRADLEFLDPGVRGDDAAHQWLAMGTKLVVITSGKEGATGFTARGTVQVASPNIRVVDSVGAGDAFMSGLLAWLHHHERLNVKRLDRMGEDEMEDALRFAASAAALACTRPGADPPRLTEITP